jgi:hypothetical protein
LPKRGPDLHHVPRLAATEIALVWTLLTGNPGGWTVTNIAAGHSGGNSFGARLAVAVAERLTLAYLQVWHDLPQAQRRRRRELRCRLGIAMTRQDVEDDIGRMVAAGEGLGADRLDRSQTVAQYTADRILTIWRSPSSEPFSRRRTHSRLTGNSQSLKGAQLRSTPDFLASTGT